MKGHQREIRILVADDEQILAERLVEFLASNGFYTRYVRNGAEARKVLQTWKPDFILCDLMLPDMNAMEFLRMLQAHGMLGDDKIKFFVLSGHNNPQNVKESMKLGAADYLVKPIKHADLLARIVLHVQATKHELPDLTPASIAASGKTEAAATDQALYFLHLTDLTLRESLKGLPTTETLHNLTRMVSFAMKAVRVSYVKCDMEERRGEVFASSDKKDIDRLELDLQKYPEILYVLHHDRLLALDNLAVDPTMSAVARQNKSIHFNSMIVCPIRLDGQMWGVLSLRLPAEKKTLTDAEIRYAQLVAHVGGLLLRSDSGGANKSLPKLRVA